MVEDAEYATTGAGSIEGFGRLLARAFIPLWVVAPYSLWALPTWPGLAYLELAWYQQLGSIAFPVALAWSLYRFWVLVPEYKQTVEDKYGVEVE